MHTLRNALWWTCFLCLSIVLQVHITRLDALIVGVIIVTEERDYRTMVWLLPLIVLLQEGMGTQHFGASVLMLAAFFALYRAGRGIENASPALFVLVISLGLGCARGFLDWLFCALQAYPFSPEGALHDAIVQAVYTPLAWLFFARLRRRYRHDSKADA